MLPRQAISAPSAWRFRPVLKWLHLWLGLSVGLVFAVVSLTGTVLAFQSELLLAAHPELERERLPPLALQGHALARIVAEAEESGIRSIDLPSPRLPAGRRSPPRVNATTSIPPMASFCWCGIRATTR